MQTERHGCSLRRVEFFTFHAVNIDGSAILPSVHSCNCFVAYRDVLQAIRWDEELKVDEHWDFFWRAKVAGIKVGVAMDHVFPHIHVDPPAYKRHRPKFLQAALLKHGLKKVLWK